MSNYRDYSALGVFVENHDNARFLNMFGDRTRFLAAIAFTLFAKGIPIVYYGGE
jgi:alpha-amylase